MNRSTGYRFFVWFFRLFLLAFVLAPLLWGLRTSFSMTNYDPRIIPKEVTIQNYIAVLHNEAFYTSVLNSIFYSAVSVALLLLIIVPCLGFLQNNTTTLLFIGPFFRVNRNP